MSSTHMTPVPRPPTAGQATLILPLPSRSRSTPLRHIPNDGRFFHHQLNMPHRGIGKQLGYGYFGRLFWSVNRRDPKRHLGTTETLQGTTQQDKKPLFLLSFLTCLLIGVYTASGSLFSSSLEHDGLERVCTFNESILCAASFCYTDVYCIRNDMRV
jgi:hypothetical protein